MSSGCRPVLSRQPAFSRGSSRRGTRTRSNHVLSFAVSADESSFASPTALSRTEYVAETLLPTRNGLSPAPHATIPIRTAQVDGGASWTEPTAIVYGTPEGGHEISHRFVARGQGQLRRARVFTSSGATCRITHACDNVVPVRCPAFHWAVTAGQPQIRKPATRPPNRVHAEVLGSMKCDCAEQLELSLEYIRDHSPGLVIYLQQEGRGIGLANKIAAYALQEKGFDTVDANRQLGLPDDAREYTSVKHILGDLNIASIRLITNNPRKIRLLEALGVSVTGRIPCLVKPGEFSSSYLEAKGRRMDHLDLDGSWCYWDHSGEKDPPHPPKPVDEQTF